MYGRAIRFAAINVEQSTCRSFFLSTQPNYSKGGRNLIDDIRESASGMPPSPPSDHRVNVVRTSTTTPPSDSTTPPSASTSPPSESGGSYMKEGVVKAMERGLDIGEMAKKTLDNVWDVTKDTTHKVKEAVAGETEEKYDVPPTDHFVDDLRKHAGGYDQRRKN